MLKRIFLFGLVNILVMVTVTTLFRLLNIEPYLNGRYGLNIQSLAIYCLIWGFAGSFISLMLSKVMAKFMMGVKIINPNNASGENQELFNMVQRLAQSAGLPKTPEVGVYESQEVNAFATGPSKGNALVAVSTGLLQRMSRSEIEGVIGHEIAHIANGDMVTMTLIQGVINSFVLFFSKIVAWAVSNAMRGENDRPNYMISFAIEIVLQIVFGLLGSLVVARFSRWREFRADKGGAQFAGRDKMIGALNALKTTLPLIENRSESIAAFKISGGGKFLKMFSTHPPLEERIQRLRQGI